MPDPQTTHYTVERHDQEDGSITYEVWSHHPYYRICSINDRHDNASAKRDAEFIAKSFEDAWL